MLAWKPIKGRFPEIDVEFPGGYATIYYCDGLGWKWHAWGQLHVNATESGVSGLAQTRAAAIKAAEEMIR